MREMEGNKERTTLAMAVARMWKDPEYKRQLISDPKSVLRSEGVNFGEHTVVKVVEETSTIKYVDLGTAEQSAQETVARLLPLANGEELRIVQSTESLRYLVLPAAPGWISPSMSRGDDLLKFSTELPPTIVSETTVLDSQVVTAENVAVEQMVQQSMQAEELIVESAVVVETVSQSAQEVQLVEVAAEFESSVSEMLVMDSAEVTVAEVNVANVATVAETVTIV